MNCDKLWTRVSKYVNIIYKRAQWSAKPNLRHKRRGVKWSGRPAGSSGSWDDDGRFQDKEYSVLKYLCFHLCQINIICSFIHFFVVPCRCLFHSGVVVKQMNQKALVQVMWKADWRRRLSVDCNAKTVCSAFSVVITIHWLPSLSLAHTLIVTFIYDD